MSALAIELIGVAVGAVLAAGLAGIGFLVVRALNQTRDELRSLKETVDTIEDRMREHELVTAKVEAIVTHLSADHKDITEWLRAVEQRLVDHLSNKS